MSAGTDSLARYFGMACLVAGLAGCGGGGGEKDLTLTFNYPGGSPELFTQQSISPRITGLDGNSPTCNLQSGELAPGLTLRSDCTVIGAPTAPGSYSAIIRLTVSGFRGEVTAGFGQIVPALTLAPVKSSESPTGLDRTLNLFRTLANTPLWTQVGYTRQAGDETTFSVVSGVLPVGLTLDVATGSIDGEPTQVQRANVSFTMRLKRGGSEIASTPLTLSLSVVAPALVIDYASCCGAVVGVALFYRPMSSFEPRSGATIRYQAIGQMPSGLSIDESSGSISGTPQTDEHGNSGFFVQVTSTRGGDTQTLDTAAIFIKPAGLYGIYSTSSQGYSTLLVGIPGDPPKNLRLRVDRSATFSIAPASVFGARPGDVIRYSLQVGGFYNNPVPTWLSINTVTGNLTGQVPEGIPQNNEFAVQITVSRDGIDYAVKQYWDLF